ncbi:MAG: serine/threonine-protein kinase [Polyangiales bacterium]
MVGTTLDGRYQLDALIGEGGGGQVYRATHLALERPVAVKLLLQELEVSEVAKARFSREAKTLAALRHPNIVTVIDFGFGEFPFLVLELVQGCELEELVEEGPMEMADALSVMKQLLGALAYAHEAGVIHRDLKPSNLFVRRLTAGLHIEVLDFGLAKFIGGEAEAEADIKVTRAGHIVGTPAYMAPEQIGGDPVDKRADQYGAAVVLFEMLTGQLPFHAPEVMGVLRAHLTLEPPTLARTVPDRSFSPELEALVARALAKDPSERYPDVPAMLVALNNLPETGRLSDITGSMTHTRSAGENSAPDTEEESVLETAKRAVSELGSAIAKHVEPAPESEPSGLPAPPKALIIGTVVVFLFALGYWLVGDGGTTPTSGSAAPSAASEVDGESEDVPLGENTPEVDPSADPWAEVPAELAAYKRRIDEGGRLRRRQIGSLRSYASEHPGDARPLLLHARAYVAQGSLSQALPYFLRAFETDIRARNDPEMLADLIHMATTETLEQEAADAIRRIYGSAARTAVAKAVAEQSETARRERLQRLVQTLD